MTEAHKHPNYMAIFWALLLLTIIEIVVAQFPTWLESIPRIFAMTVILLIALAFTKALLVALFFMHLRFERKPFIAIVSAPLVLALVLVVGLLFDHGH